MQGVQLFNLASQQARWLSARQAAIAGNIANANTPGYAAVDVEPFQKVLSRAAALPMATQAGHRVGASGGDWSMQTDDTAVPLSPSGNGVVLEDELLKAGEVRRAFEMNTAIVKSFHRMLMMTVRG